MITKKITGLRRISVASKQLKTINKTRDYKGRRVYKAKNH